jgi:hypothetical protein
LVLENSCPAADKKERRREAKQQRKVYVNLDTNEEE